MVRKQHLKWIGLIFAGLLLFTTAFFWQQRGVTVAEIGGGKNGELPFLVRVSAGQDYKLRLLGTREQKRTLLWEKDYIYKVVQGNQVQGEVQVKTRQFPDGDILVFLSGQGEPTGGELLQQIEIVLPDGLPAYRKSLDYGEDRYNYTYSHWDTHIMGEEDYPLFLPPELTLLKGEGGTLCLGTAEMVSDMGRGVFKEVERMAYHVEKLSQDQADLQGTRLRLTVPDFAGDLEMKTWFYFSREEILDMENKEQLDLLRRGDLNRFRKFYGDGIYDLVPVSYEPTHGKGFWRCPAQHVGRAFMNNSRERFFQNIAAATVYTTISAQNEQGYWSTVPKSLWLHKDYGIGENFYDTRFSTDAAMFLMEAYQHFNETAALFSAGNYAAFLMDFAREHSHITSGGGYLPMDYMDASGVAENHSSLNHVLAEMNFLYRMYLITAREDYMAVADKMLRGVKDTRDQCIKGDGDLWYCRFVDGTYGLQDYPTLTLKDLREAQQILTRLYQQPDPDLTKLINSKESYNKRHGLPIW